MKPGSRRDRTRRLSASQVRRSRASACAGVNRHDRTTPRAHRPAGHDHSRLAHPIPHLASLAQDAQVATRIGPRARGLAGHDQSGGSLGLVVQTDLPGSSCRCDQGAWANASTGAQEPGSLSAARRRCREPSEEGGRACLVRAGYHAVLAVNGGARSALASLAGRLTPIDGCAAA